MPGSATLHQVKRSIFLAVPLLVFLSVTTYPASPSPSDQEPTSVRANPATPDDPVERQYRKLLELDEAAQDEVDLWIQAELDARQASGGAPDPTLRARALQRFDPVRKAYDDFILRHPRYVPARIAYASLLGDLGDESGAVEQLETARELDPSNPAIWNNLAHFYSHGGPIDRALRYFEKAIDLKPDEATYYQNLATMVFLFRPDAMKYYNSTEPEIFERSLSLYRKAIQLDPNNFPLASDYALSYYGIRPPASLDPDDQLAAQQDLNRRAILAWDYALRIANTEEQRQGVHIHLARIKTNQGHFDQAKAHLDAVNLDILQTLKSRLARTLEERSNPTPITTDP